MAFLKDNYNKENDSVDTLLCLDTEDCMNIRIHVEELYRFAQKKVEQYTLYVNADIATDRQKRTLKEWEAKLASLKSVHLGCKKMKEIRKNKLEKNHG